MELMLFFFFFCLRHGRQRDWCGASAVSQRVSVRKRLRGEDHLFASCPCKAVQYMFSLYIKWGNRTAPAARAPFSKFICTRPHNLGHSATTLDRVHGSWLRWLCGTDGSARGRSRWGAPMVDGDDDPDDELETCCICLDSLSSSPAVALLDGRRPGQPECERSCAHFFHSACAERLAPQLCPMCRTPFSELSAPFSGDGLVAAGATRVIAGARRLRGEDPTLPTVAARTVVELLAASFPIQQASLEAAVEELADAVDSPGHKPWVVSSPRSGTTHIGAQGLVQMLERCSPTLRLQLQATAQQQAQQPATPTSADEEPSFGLPFSSYTLATRLSRRLRWLALKGAGAAGTALFAGGIGAGVGVWCGALAAIPRGSLLRPLQFMLDIPDPAIGFVMGGISLAFSMLRHGAERRDLLWRGVWSGGAIGVVMGGVGALAVVDPGDHGFSSVFLSGVRGRSLFSMLRWLRPQVLRRGRTPEAERVDVFAPIEEAEAGAR